MFNSISIDKADITVLFEEYRVTSTQTGQQKYPEGIYCWDELM